MYGMHIFLSMCFVLVNKKNKDRIIRDKRPGGIQITNGGSKMGERQNVNAFYDQQ
jgi:hypothetical protein